MITATTPYELDSNFPNLEGINRYERAVRILDHQRSIKRVNAHQYSVRSQQGIGEYVVTIKDGQYKCNCPDCIINNCECKHIIAVKEFIRRNDLARHERRNENPTADTRDWNAYTLAQKSEYELFPIYLRQLVDLIAEPERKITAHSGRKPTPLSDKVFMAVSKVASMLSSRRAFGEIADAVDSNLLPKEYSYNAVNVFLSNPENTPLLRELVRMSAYPLKNIEKSFAVDSSGFGTYQYGDWMPNKWEGVKRQHTFVKAHIICGVMSNIITDAVVTDSTVGDSKVLPQLVEGTTGRFKADEVLADAGYMSNDNYDAIQKCGAKGFIEFKDNVTGAGSPAWREAVVRFITKQEEFYKAYNKRNNVETTFNSIKTKYQEKVKSKTTNAQINELYCKIIAYNISVVIRMAHSDNIEVMFK